MLQNNVGLLTPVNYYEDNYPCKISISCQCAIALVFFILSLLVFYVTSFFGEIGLARLADTKSLFGAFDFKAIFKLIDSFGWRHYARDLTSIVVAISILTFIQTNLPEFFGIEVIIWAILGVLIFATQYLGIGSVYCNIKDNELKQTIEIK